MSARGSIAAVLTSAWTLTACGSAPGAPAATTQNGGIPTSQTASGATQGGSSASGPAMAPSADMKPLAEGTAASPTLMFHDVLFAKGDGTWQGGRG